MDEFDSTFEEENQVNQYNEIFEEIFGADSPNEDFEGSIDAASVQEQRNADGEKIMVGMAFETINDIFQRYQQFAHKEGFCAIKRGVSKDRNGNPKYAKLTCEKSRKMTSEKISKKSNCPATLNASFNDQGMWIVNSINNEHNHDLDPDMSRFMRGHKKITGREKRLLEANDIAGIGMSKSIRILEVESGGPDMLGSTERDYRNFIANCRRSKIDGGDAESINRLFQRMRAIDPNFFYEIDVDDEGRLRNVMWVHPRMKAAFSNFGDVICVDTTYLVNKYKMPFGSFVGVNHHGHSILLGCFLVSHEDIETYRWVFRTWLTAMRGCQPKAMMTDQCDSMKAAIKEEMPEVVHRFCLWHIFCKVPVKFKGVEKFKDCSNDFKSIVLDSITSDMFERRWDEFCLKYGLEDNEWLKRLYEERMHWIPTYLNNIFWAGMLSTQRSEGMHAYFDSYINRNSTLKQFVEQYEIALRRKIRKEIYADYQSMHFTLALVTNYQWEKEFQRVYTNEIYNQVKKVIIRLVYCFLVENGNDEVPDAEGFESFEVLEKELVNNWYRKEHVYNVRYKSDKEEWKCNCKLFESMGLLCCHIFKVISAKNIREIPNRYIIKRWRKDVVRSHTKLILDAGYPNMTESYKQYISLDVKFNSAVDMSMGDRRKMNFMSNCLDELKKRLESWEENDGDIIVEDEVTQNSVIKYNNILFDPVVARTVGRPPNRIRLKSYREMAIEQARSSGRGRSGGRNTNTTDETNPNRDGERCGNRGRGRSNGRNTSIRGGRGRGRNRSHTGGRGRGRILCTPDSQNEEAILVMCSAPPTVEQRSEFFEEENTGIDLNLSLSGEQSAYDLNDQDFDNIHFPGWF